MRERYGNMWDFANEYDAVCILTNMEVRNGCNIMGAGSAREAAQRYPQLPYIYGQMLLSFPRPNLAESPFAMALLPDEKPVVMAFATKSFVSEPSSVNLIERSCLDLARIIMEMGWKSVLLPRPGCGKWTGQLDWDKDVKPICEQYLPHDIVTIAHYEMEIK